MQHRNKRRRFAPNTDALQSALRTSFASATHDAGLASRARARATGVLAKSVAAEAFAAAAVSLCREGGDDLVEAEASAGFCRVAREDAAEALRRSAVAEKSFLRAASAVSGLAKRLGVGSGSGQGGK